MNTIQTLAISAIPIIFAITLHEAAHGYAARHFGDPTAWQMGRISLNPLRHVDLVGTIIVPAITLLVGGILFGWAKPVPVNFGRLRQPKKDMLWVAAAGPAANLAMALGWALMFKLVASSPESAYSAAMLAMAKAGLSINGVLMILNLLPLPPLDGGRILVSLLPVRAAYKVAQLERFGLPILFLLLFLGVLDRIMHPLMNLYYLAMQSLLGF